MASPINTGEMELDAAAEKYAKWAAVRMNRHDTANKITRRLYHYTSADGLLNILKSGMLWFSSIHHMNDPSELRYGMMMALDELRRIQPDTKGAAARLVQRSIYALEQGAPTTPFNYFIASFSHHADDLGQWRAYGDNGKGYALGIKPEYFKIVPRAAKIVSDRVVVSRILYDERAARTRQREATRKAVEAASSVDTDRFNDRSIQEFVRQINIQLWMLYLWNALTCKHPSYEHEQEVRLLVIIPIAMKNAGILTRAARSELIPYIEVPIDFQKKRLIASITAGPVSGGMSEQATTTMIDSLHSQGRLKQSRRDLINVITRSTIPYRG